MSIKTDKQKMETAVCGEKSSLCTSLVFVPFIVWIYSHTCSDWTWLPFRNIVCLHRVVSLWNEVFCTLGVEYHKSVFQNNCFNIWRSFSLWICRRVVLEEQKKYWCGFYEFCQLILLLLTLVSRRVILHRIVLESIWKGGAGYLTLGSNQVVA